MLSIHTTSKKALFLSCLFSVFWSCIKDKENPPMAAENTKQMEETTPVGESEAIGEKLFEQLKFANQQSETIWKGYDYSSFPKYFILQKDDYSQPQLGYIVDPGEEIEGANKIPDGKSHGLNVFRFDEKIKDANRQLGRGNKLFDFEYEIGSHDHYLQTFNENDVESGQTSEIAIHEVFHIFQRQWEYTFDFIQDIENYPINSDLLPLQILLTEIGGKMPKEIDKDNIKKYLSMYVAIRSKEMALDPTENELVRRMANFQETGEGTAKYVDYSFGSQLFSRMDSYALSDDFKEAISSSDDARDFFAWGIWYETGAAVTHMLKQLGVPLEEELKKGKMLYEVAENLLNLSDEEKETFLAQAKKEFEFDTKIIPESERILALGEDGSTAEEATMRMLEKQSFELYNNKYFNSHK